MWVCVHAYICMDIHTYIILYMHIFRCIIIYNPFYLFISYIERVCGDLCFLLGHLVS